MSRVKIAEILRVVNLDRGHFSVGFTEQSDERRNLIRAGKTQDEHINDDTADAVRKMEEGGQKGSGGGNNTFVTQMLGMMPREVVSDMVREVSSGFRNTHCELCFYVKQSAQTSDKNVLGVALRANGVVIEMRNYSRESYVWSHVLCTPEQMKAILMFACAEQGRPFDEIRMAKSVTEPGPDKRDRYFCSQFVMACLEHLPHPVFHFNRANVMNNDDVKSILRAESVVCRNPPEVPNSVFDKAMGADSRYAVRPGETALPRQSGKKLASPKELK